MFILQARTAPSSSDAAAAASSGMVPRRRLELPRPFGHRYLKPARLPIPPPGQQEGAIVVGCLPKSTGISLVRRSDRGLYLRPQWHSGGAPARRKSRSVMAARFVTVFGGSGFIWRYLVQRLARHGWIVRVAVRHPDRALFLKPMGAVGQITPVAASLRHDGSGAAAVAGADAVVNLVGILCERGAQTFAAVHAMGAATVAEAAKAAGARTFVHMSALGADPAASAQY